MSYKTRDGKTHQSQVLITDSGLPIDGIATISGSYVFITDETSPLVYTALAATVTLPVGSDLAPVVSAKARYTGRYVLITKDNQIYYINRPSIDVGARTFVISRSDSSQITPASIDLSPGWTVAEADIVNRLATTSSAKIDSIEFRDMHFQMSLDGDPVTILNADDEKINPATEEKQNDQIVELELINDELDTITLQLAQIDDQINQDYGTSADAIRTASQIGNSTGAADFNTGPIGPQTLRTASVMLGVTEQGNVANVALSNSNSVKVAIADRPSELRGRTRILLPIIRNILTGAPTVLHTTTPGTILYISSFLISALNSSAADGQFQLRDDTTVLVDFLVPSRVSGSSPSSFSVTAPTLPEPLPFMTNLNFIEITGSVEIAGYIIGYEEPI